MQHCRFCAEREVQHQDSSFCAVCQAEIDSFLGRFYPAQDVYTGTISGMLISVGLFIVSALGFAAVFIK